MELITSNDTKCSTVENGRSGKQDQLGTFLSCYDNDHLPLDLVMQASVVIYAKFHFRLEKNIHSSKTWYRNAFSMKITHSLNVQDKLSENFDRSLISLLCCFLHSQKLHRLNANCGFYWPDASCQQLYQAC